jgi:hypothetical protein
VPAGCGSPWTTQTRSGARVKPASQRRMPSRSACADSPSASDHGASALTPWMQLAGAWSFRPRVSRLGRAGTVVRGSGSRFLDGGCAAVTIRSPR